MGLADLERARAPLQDACAHAWRDQASGAARSSRAFRRVDL
jgi:hypothetical protein